MHIHSVVVGGGISGLYAAYKMINDGYNVILIEKNGRLGGRVHTIYNTDATHYEAGAGRLNKKHELLMTLIDKFGLTLTPHDKQKEYRGADGVPVRNGANGMVARVLKGALAMSEPQLQMMTFGQLCIKTIGYAKMRTLVDEFGYNAEFLYMNAKDAVDMFTMDFGTGQTYYSCREGLSELVYRMETMMFATGKFKVFKNCEVVSVKYNKQYSYSKVVARLFGGELRIFKSDIVVCALPKKELMTVVDESMADVAMKQAAHELLDSVEGVPLHRVYGKFADNWFDDIGVTVTNDPIRQFIPIDKKHNLAMVSYSDNENALYWQQYALLGEKELRGALLRHLHVVFPEVKIPKIQWVQNHYWETGVHMWKQGMDSKVLRPKIQMLFGVNVPIFVVGEAYSSHQSWIEGALKSVDEGYVHMSKFLNVNAGVGENGGGVRKIPRVKEDTIEKFLSTKGVTNWVILKVNGQRRILNTMEWARSHPGGPQVFAVWNKKDITAIWPQNHYVDPVTKEIRPTVMKVINSTTVGIVI